MLSHAPPCSLLPEQHSPLAENDELTFFLAPLHSSRKICRSAGSRTTLHTPDTQPAPGRAELPSGSSLGCELCREGQGEGFRPLPWESGCSFMHPFADTPQEFWKCHFGEGPACRVNAWEVLPALGERVKAGLGGTASPMASLVMQEENISPCKAKSYLPLTRVVHTHEQVLQSSSFPPLRKSWEAACDLMSILPLRCLAGGVLVQQERSHPTHWSAWAPARRGTGGDVWSDHIWQPQMCDES